MKSVIDFWKKDIINKLIVLVSLGLAGGIFAFGWLIFHISQGRSLSEAFADFIPARATPTFDVNSHLTPNANLPTLGTPTTAARAMILPTFTLPPPTPTLGLPTPTLEIPSPTLTLPTQTAQLVATAAQPASEGLSCIPNNPPQKGTVVEILDGVTIRVYIEKLVYVVRYIGISSPTDKRYVTAAKQKNSLLALGREVKLVPDTSDKDDHGRLLRYVVAGDSLINLEIVKQGFGSALDVPPNSSCSQAFQNAEQSARTSLLGMWKFALTPSP